VLKFLRGRAPKNPRWGLVAYDEQPSFGAAVGPRAAAKRRAFLSAANLMVVAEKTVGLSPDRDRWTRAGWEAFLNALVRVLAKAALNNQRLAAQAGPEAAPDAMGGAQGLLGSGTYRMKVGERIVVETFAGTRSVVVPLDGGVYLVGEASALGGALDAPTEVVVGALESAAQESLRGRPLFGAQRWTDRIRGGA